MNDNRVPFDAAREEFLAFLAKSDWPTDILWLSRERIIGRRRTYWIYRPDELSSDRTSRDFYEAARKTASSIRIDAVGTVGARTLAVVENFGGPSRMLNFGISLEPWIVRPVRWRLGWAMIHAVSSLWGGATPTLRCARITGTRDSEEERGRAIEAFYRRDIRRWLA